MNRRPQRMGCLRDTHSCSKARETLASVSSELKSEPDFAASEKPYSRYWPTFVRAILISGLLAIVLPGAIAPALAQNVENPPTRSLRISTKEVTDPDVAVSSDGRWLVFTALGHLFRLPAAGGVAKQLTFGPYYDSAPAISPDGMRVAFISDRKVSSQGNVFVLDLASGQIHQLTDEAWANRPAWSPDGKSLAFLSYRVTGPAATTGWSAR